MIHGDGTNLCLQAETDMIMILQMKEDMKMEDQILMLYYSVFPLVSGSVNHSIPCLYTNS